MAIGLARCAFLSLWLLATVACQAPPPTTPTAATFTLSGRVTTSAPSLVPLSGVVVQVVDGPMAGRSTKTDEAGEFRLTGLVGVITVLASSPGYESQRLSVDVTDARNIRLTLKPELQILETTLTKQATAVGACDSPCRVYVLNIHNDGTAEVNLTWPVFTDGPLKMSLWLGDTLIAQSFRANTGREFLSAPVTGGFGYQLRVAGDTSDFQLFIRRPN